MGASFFGGVGREQFALTEKSIWAGKPAMGDWESVGVNPEAKETIPKIRELVVAGEAQAADELIVSSVFGTGENFGHFSSLGNLYLEIHPDGEGVTDYVRELDLQQSIGRVRYRKGGIRFSREYFCSYPDRVLGMHLASDHEAAVGFTLSTEIMQEMAEVTIHNGRFTVRGTVDGSKRPYVLSVLVKPVGGEVTSGADWLKVEGADTVDLFLTISTDYAMRYPDYRGEPPGTVVKRVLDVADAMGFDQLRERHVEDYRELYDRVYLDLRGNEETLRLPTNERFTRLRAGKPDRGYMELAFNLGRYMIISASRPGALPANLQGAWNAFKVAPWSGNYQSNINLQEIYWSCGSMDLNECHEPYLDWIEDLAHSGREVAQRVYGTGGWVSHTTGNIWGHAAPYGGIRWGMYPVGAAWHCQHLWDYFLYTGDMGYLEEQAYPLMKEASQFWLENLVPFGVHYITAPSVSAEHGALMTEEGLNPAFFDLKSDQYHYSLPGVYQDIQMIHGLFTETATAARLLGDEAFADDLELKRLGLLPMRVGQHGQLQEWFDDIDHPDGRHRHIGHLYAISPGTQIHPLKTPGLAKAAEVSLNMRGDGRFMDQELAAGGNWSRAHRMWCWARLMDGNRSFKILSGLLTEQGFENGLTFQHADYHWEQGKDFLIEDDLYLHFQLDGSAAIPGLIGEMLLQTHMGEIYLLPALPDAFPQGVIRGLKGRGGFTFDIEWRGGELLRATITVPEGVEKVPPIYLKDRRVRMNRQNRIKIVWP